MNQYQPSMAQTPGALLIADTTLSSDSLISTNMNQADTSSFADTTSVFIQDLEHFVESGFRIVIAPLIFDAQDWKRVGAITAGTGLLFLLDKPTKAWVQRNRNPINDEIFNLDRYYGNKYLIFFPWAVYGYGALIGNDKIRIIGRNATEALIFSGAITGGIKLLLGRRRPFLGDGNIFFRPLTFSDDSYQSLPSGHTTLSFAVSTVMAKSLDNIYWKIFWYGSAGLVGASRIYHNKHWLSDVALGAVIGYSVGSFVINFDRKTQGRIFSLRFQPYYGPTVVGMRCYF